MNRKIRTWVEISLNDLEHNYREISSRLPDGCQMLGVCKANAYGHGAVRVAQRLQRAGCQWVAVNCYDEAEELRAAGVTMNILLLGPQSANIAVDLATLGVTQAVGSIEYARELNRFLAGTGLRLCLPLQIAHTPDFFELVPRGFLTLGVRRDQEHLLPQRTLLVCDLLNGAGQKLVFLLALIKQQSDRAMPTMTGQDFISAVRQRCHDQIIKDATCKLNGAF